MAEKKKETNKKPEEKKKKNISNENKKAVSSKKDTAKVVSKKNNKKPEPKKKITPKEEAINAIDEELLENKSNIKNQYKKEALEKLAEEKETTQIQEETKEEVVYNKGALDELIGPSEQEESTEDTGLFSSKVVLYLFFILALIIGCLIYVYNEEIPKNKVEAEAITNTKKELKVGENNLPSFSQEDAIEAINNYYSIKKNIEYMPLKYLQDCGLTTPEKAAKYSENKSGVYFKTDVAYDDLRKTFENYISRECFEKTFRKYYKNSSGMVSCMTGQGILRDYEIKTVAMLEAPAGRPTLKVTYSVTSENGETTEKTNTFEFKVVKGIWVINSIT